MRHRHDKRWNPYRKHHRYHKQGYKVIAETALQVVGVLATAFLAVLFKKKP